MSEPLSSVPDTPHAAGRLFANPYLLLVLAPTFWGGNLVAGKLAVGNIPPSLLLMGRWIGAVAILLVIALPHLRRDWPEIRPALGWLILYGALGFATFNMLMYSAAPFTSAVNASIEQASIPVMVLLGNFFVYKVRARLLQILGLVLTIAGVGFVATHGDLGRILTLDVGLGDGMVLMACLTYAIYSLTLRYRPQIHWLSFMAVTAIAALLMSLIYQMAFGGGMGAFVAGIPHITPLGWAAVVYVMVFPSILAQLAYARGVELVGPNRASIFINLLPITGTLLSVLVIGERLEPFHLVAAVLVIAGIGLSELSVRLGHRPEGLK